MGHVHAVSYIVKYTQHKALVMLAPMLVAAQAQTMLLTPTRWIGSRLGRRSQDII